MYINLCLWVPVPLLTSLLARLHLIPHFQAAEFFVNNQLYSKVRFANTPLDCSKSSDPFEQQAAMSPTAEDGLYHFVPTLAGYPEDW